MITKSHGKRLYTSKLLALKRKLYNYYLKCYKQSFYDKLVKSCQMVFHFEFNLNINSFKELKNVSDVNI